MFVTATDLPFQLADLLNGAQPIVLLAPDPNPVFTDTVKFGDLYPPGYTPPRDLVSLLLDPAALGASEVGLIVLSVVVGTVSMRQQLQIKQRKHLNTIQAQQSLDIDTLSQDTLTQMPIPTFAVLLKRNTILSLFFVPLAGFVILLGVTVLFFLFDSTRRTPGSGLVYLVIPISGVAVYGAVFVGRTIERFVDRRLQPKPSGYFVAEADVPPSRITTALAASSPLAQSEPIPESAKAARQRGERNTPEAISSCNFAILLMGMIIGGVLIGLLAGVIARLSGASKDTIQLAFAVPTVLGFGLPFIGYRWLIKLFPKPQWQRTIDGWTPLLRQGKYGVVLAQAERLMQESPNWSIQILAASAYTEAGQFEKAEQLLRLTLHDLVEKITAENDHSVFYNDMLGKARVVLINVLVLAGKLDEAEADIHKLQPSKEVDATLERTLAKLYLYRGKVDLALPHLNAAEQQDRKKRAKASAFKTAFSAWGAAAQGDSA